MHDSLPRGRRPTWARARAAVLSVGAIVTLGSFAMANRADQTAVPTTTTTTAVPTTTQAPPQAEHPLTVGSWDLVLGEDFSAGELDQETWVTCYWWDDAGCTIYEQLQWYLPDNVAVADGVLTLSAIREDNEGANGRRHHFSSGMVSTGPASYQGTAGLSFTHGYVEMRARVPAGSGLWPSFWMLPTDFESKPEIDIMQVLGDSPTKLHVHLHTVDTTGVVKSYGSGSTESDLSQDWHVYGLLWTNDALVWYLDGTEVWRYGGGDIPNEPMYLVANLTVGGDYAGPPDPATAFPATFEIDFIRIWQQE